MARIQTSIFVASQLLFLILVALMLTSVVKSHPVFADEGDEGYWQYKRSENGLAEPNYWALSDSLGELGLSQQHAISRQQTLARMLEKLSNSQYSDYKQSQEIRIVPEEVKRMKWLTDKRMKYLG